MSEAIADLPKGDYKLISFEAGDFTDNHGNYWCNAAFEGVSEPVRWVVKDPTQVNVGNVYYGHFTLETSKANNTYIRFRREQKPDNAEPQQAALPIKQDDGYWDDKNAQIRAQWAIGQAVQLASQTTKPELTTMDWVAERAQELFAMVDRVKAPQQAELPPPEQVTSGYEKAKATAASIKQTFNDGSPVPDEIIEDIGDEPISLDDIPF